jgi:phospholipase C
MPSQAEARSRVRALDADNPFPGLRPYEERDATWFFGRGREINDLLKRLGRVHFLAVLGPSGFGKSSLVKAGVLPAVRDGYLDASWRVAILSPGNRPLDRLASALSEALGCKSEFLRESMERGPAGLIEAVSGCKLGDAHLLVVVDQFEELFHLVLRKGEAGQEEVKAFLRLLLTVAASDTIPFYVIITMRLEWLNECASYPGLSETINVGGYLVPQMTRRQFQQAIRQPIEAAGGTITATLTDRLLNDLDGRTDQLPVLQHVLMRMWRKAGRETTLDVPLYEAIGALSLSLSKHAEEIYGALTKDQQSAAQGLFRSVTQVSKNRRLRKPTLLGEIQDKTGAPFESLTKVVEAFSREGRSFLMVSPGPLNRDSIIDVSHEALIRQWNRLRDWVDEEGELVARTNRLEDIAGEWDRGKREDGSLLYRGAVLKKAEELKPRLNPGDVGLEFLQASRRAQWRSHLFWRGGFIVLSLGLLAFGGRTLWNWKKAQAKKTGDFALYRDQRNNLWRVAQDSRDWQQVVATSLSGQGGPTNRLIYFQYPGTEKVGLAEKVQEYLKGQGYLVPDIEDVGTHAPQETQVRYFFAADAAEAEKLANVLRSAVAGGVKTQLTAYSPKSPPAAGQLEIWLSMAARAVPKIAIRHLIVLMLEGRSFDHMLGYLKSVNADIDGLTGQEWNPDSLEAKVPVSDDAVGEGPFDPDPGQSFPDVNFQVYGNFEGRVGRPMLGFVQSYGFHTQQVESSHKIMKCMRASTIPVLSVLAQQYALCDHWFSSVPGPTFPNRAFVHAGTSMGRVDNTVTSYAAVPKTIYELLDDNKVTARIYYSDSSLAQTFRGLQQKPSFFGTLEEFLASARNGTIPAYSFLEPRYSEVTQRNGVHLLASDEHAGHSMAEGEQLIHSVYEALRENKEVWESSILVITYAQHGGFYDHEMPPATVSPDGVISQDPGQGVAKIPPFDFRRLGARVPAVVISPYIDAGTIDHTVYDHTSVIATARKLFLGRGAATSYLTERDRLANTFDHVLTRTTARTDNPIP